MKTKRFFVGTRIVVILIMAITLIIPCIAAAHCDTLDGPVVTTAKNALEKGDVTPVLKWVNKKDEKEILDIFQKTIVARRQGKEARELADSYFFETLVRIHRAGEGAPYTGLKSEPVEPAVQAADKSLDSRSVDALVKMITDASAQGIRERFARTVKAKEHADESVEKGREFVEAYVEFTHYVERLHQDASGKKAEHYHEPGAMDTMMKEHHP